MRKRSFRQYFLFFCVLLLPLGACGPKYQAAKSQRQLERRMEQRKKEGERAMSQARQRHSRVQDKQTQQRMKQTRRQSDNLINNKGKRPFYIRWYESIKARRHRR